MSEDKFVEEALGISEEARHLDGCADCQAEAAELNQQLGELRDAFSAWARRDEGFWEAQRAALRERLRPSPAAVALPWRWAAATAVLTLVGALLLGAGRTPPPTAQSAAQPDPDYVLMVNIERSLGSAPQALAPTGLLAAEMTRGTQKNLASPRTRTRAEN